MQNLNNELLFKEYFLNFFGEMKALSDKCANHLSKCKICESHEHCVAMDYHIQQMNTISDAIGQAYVKWDQKFQNKLPENLYD